MNSFWIFDLPYSAWQPFLLGFGLGSIPFGYILTSLFAKTDIRSHGSGNVGATNVARVAGKKIAALTFFLDAGKGWAALSLAAQFFPEQSPLMTAAIGAVLGHVFTPFLNFKGGKGIATAFGALLYLAPFMATLGIVVWVCVFLFSRISSLSAMTAFLVITLAAIFSSALNLSFMVTLFMLVLFTHRENLGRLLRGEEKKI